MKADDWRVVLVAQAEIDSNVRAELPLVVDVGKHTLVASAAVQLVERCSYIGNVTRPRSIATGTSSMKAAMAFAKPFCERCRRDCRRCVPELELAAGWVTWSNMKRLMRMSPPTLNV